MTRERVLAVGRDVAVTGFDPMLWMIEPTLTTLSFPVEEAADTLVERCLREHEEDPVDEPGRYITAYLIPGDSA